MMLDMNADGVPDYDPVTQDLFLYNETNTGNPIAWNPNCIVYKYREYLETRRARPRRFFNQILYPEPPGLPLSQRPNYWNNLGNGVETAPYLFISPDRGLFCGHYWSGATEYKRSNIYANQISGWNGIDFNYLTMDNTLVTLDKSKMRFGYTWIENVVNGGQDNLQNRKSINDIFIVEYEGNEMQGKKFPKYGNYTNMGHHSFDFFFLIDSQDKVYAFSSELMRIQKKTRFGFDSNGIIPHPYYTITTGDQIQANQSFAFLTHSQIVGIAVGDSGSPLYGVKDGIVYYLTNFDNKSLSYSRDELQGNKLWAPDFKDQTYAKLPYSALPPVKQPAKKTTINDIKEKIRTIKETLL